MQPSELPSLHCFSSVYRHWCASQSGRCVGGRHFSRGLGTLLGPRGLKSQVRGHLRFEFPEIYAQLQVVPWRLEFLQGLTSGSKRRFWWRCTADDNRPAGCTCEHVWQTMVQNRCHGKGCPFCSGIQVCLCTSVAKKAPGMLEFWHFERNVKVSPQQIGMWSYRKVWWRHICATTGEEHEWQAIISSVSTAYMSRGRAPCPICSGRMRRDKLVKVN